MSVAPYRIPEAAPDYEADDITDALVAAALRADDAETARVEADRVPCAKCGIYTVAAEGDTCSACDEERFGERCDFNDDGHEVMR